MKCFNLIDDIIYWLYYRYRDDNFVIIRRRFRTIIYNLKSFIMIIQFLMVNKFENVND
jgi:hypothetical protein